MDDRYDNLILKMCEALHGDHTGSGPDYEWAPCGEAGREEDLQFLKGRLSRWREGPERTKAYDDAVNALIVATLAERGMLEHHPDPCVWSYHGPWTASCDAGSAFEFNDGGPVANGFKFCPYCGRHLVEE